MERQHLAAVRDQDGPLARDDIERIVRVWQQRLRLDLWEIRIDWTRETEHVAEVKPWSMYDYATLAISPRFTEWSLLLANRNIVHELLHLAMRDVDAAVETAEKVMPASAFKVFEANVENADEAMVDRLATVLVELGGCA